MDSRWEPDAVDEVLIDYVMNANPKSNDDLKHYLRRYPQFREAIIDFTATWRALSILEKVLPPPAYDPVAEKELLQCAKAQSRAARRRRSSEKAF